jgi:hypothetical protein
MMRMRAKYVRLRRSSTEGIAERWKRQYRRPDGGWNDTFRHKAKDVYERLLALGESPTEDAVAEILGTGSWTDIWCEGCQSYHRLAVEIGEIEPKAYCPTCIEEAAAILKREVGC